MSSLPPEAEKLLAVDPGQFVAERDQLVRRLRGEDRGDEAAAVAALKKPSVVVFAVNRAARDRPKAGRAASEAALRVRKTQIGREPHAFKEALAELESALDLLAEVAVAHVAPTGKAPTDTMRRRVRDLLRSAVADDETRDPLVRGALTEELETAGFSPFAGMTPGPLPERAKTRKAASSRNERQEARRREREKALRGELAEAEQRSRDAQNAVRAAEREHKAAERALAAIRATLERID
ncbi:MAG: hypothetical protein M3364_05595 [Actinomycetota bacterium]|nr:hypothetical protein [Actinomycetota bacterium]